jgi:hypothetical protein
MEDGGSWSSAPANETWFRHSPLNHEKPSIRLVTVLPDLSHDGLIQCGMTFSTVGAEYTCLSYVWGLDTPSNRIRIDGTLFYVQNNLFSFLEVAREMYPGKQFWIDALSIDQSNTRERNHQVQQMGLIFYQAKFVIAWMGKRPATAEVFKVASTNIDFTDSLDRWWALFPPGLNGIRALNDLIYNAYWTRAWIAQEVLLPNKVLAQANNVTIDLSLLAKAFVNRIKYPIKYSSNSMSFHAFKELLLNRQEVMGSRLVWLIHRFQDSQCAIKRDRVFSLLSLCGEAKELKVDYDSPDELLMAEVLNLSAGSVCFCSVAVLSRSLHYQDPTQSQDYWSAGPPNERFRNDLPIIGVSLKTFQLIPSDDTFRYRCSDCGSHVWQSFVTRNMRKFCLEQICSEIGGHLYLDQADIIYHQQTPTNSHHHIIGNASFAPRKLCTSGKGVTILKTDKKELFSIQFTLQALVEIVREHVNDSVGKLGLCSNISQYPDVGEEKSYFTSPGTS